MKPRKSLFLAALLILLAAAGAAQNVQVDALQTENVDVRYESSTDTLVFTNSYMEQRISPEELYVPDDLQDIHKNTSFSYQVTDFRTGDFTSSIQLSYKNYTDPSYTDKAFELQRMLGGRPNIAEEFPRNRFKYSDQENTSINNDTGTVLSSRIEDDLNKNISFNIDLESHYEHLIVHYNLAYTNSSNQTNVVWTGKDVFSGNEPEKIPFKGEVIQGNGTHVTQEVTYDNRYDQEQYEILHVMHPEQGKISSVDFNGMEHEELEDYSYSRDAVPELRNADINPSLIRRGSNSYDYTAYNVTIPADSFKPITVTMSGKKDLTREEDGNFTVHDSNTFYTYMVGSGAALKITSGYELCGSYSQWDTLVIDANVGLCQESFDSSVTITAEDRVEVTENGFLDGRGEDGDDGQSTAEDGDSGDEGTSLTINSNDIIIEGTVLLDGGDGGDGDDSFSAGDGGEGGDGADSGSLTLDASGTLLVNSTISIESGSGGNGGDAGDETGDTAGDGGNTRRSRSVDLDAVNFVLGSNGLIDASGATAGDGGDSGGGFGGIGGFAEDITDSRTIDTVNATLKGTFRGDGGGGGDAGENAGGEDRDAGSGGDGGPLNIKTKYQDTSGFTVNIGGGSAGTSFNPDEDANGGDAGNLVWQAGYGSINGVTFIQDGGFDENDGIGGDGGDNTIEYFDSGFQVFDNTYDLAGHDEGSDGTQTTTQNAGLTFPAGQAVNFQSEDLVVFSQEQGKNDTFRIDSGDNITVEWNFTINNTGDPVSGADVNLYREDGTHVVDDQSMTETDTYSLSNGTRYTFQYNYSVPQNADSAGTWNVTADMTDVSGNRYTTTIYDFIYQYLDRTDGSPDQGNAVFGQSIPFTQYTRRTNPSNTVYEDVPIQFQFIQGTLMNSIAVINENNNEISYSTNDTSRTAFWTRSSLDPGQTYRWDLEYEIEQIDVVENVTTEFIGEREVATQNLDVRNPTTIQLEDIEARWQFYDPGRTVDWQLFFNGDEITDAAGYNALAQDFDNDGVDETLTWQIDTLPVGVEQDYDIVTDLGIPIDVFSESVITNKPVEEGKPVRWRVGYAFFNPNDFTVPFNYRLPVPVDATNIRLGGSLEDTRFGETGTYIPFEETLPIQENVTAFLKYQTRSISTTVQTRRPSNHTVDDPSRIVKNLDFENIAGKDLHTINHTISVRYGTDLNVTDVQSGEIIENQSVVQDDYTITLDNLEAADTREIRVEYFIPTPTSELVREGQSSSGNPLRVWQITNQNIEPLQDVFFVSEDIDCTEVEQIRLLSRTNQTLTNITDYRCGSTIIPMGDLDGSEVVRLAVEYDPVEETVQGNPILPPVIGFLKWVVPLSLAGAGFYLVSRRGEWLDG